LIERFNAIPGVQRAGIVSSAAYRPFTIEEHPPIPAERQPTASQFIGLSGA
jgi:hypothetical protein